MGHVIRGLTHVLISIIADRILGVRQQPTEAEKGKVHLHKSLGIIGMIGFVLFLILAMITVFLDEPLWIPIVFVCFAAFSALLIVAYINCRTTYDEKGFVAKSFFGIKREFTYDQVTAIEENFIYIGESDVMINQSAVGADEFLKLVNEKINAMHDGQATYNPQ